MAKGLPDNVSYYWTGSVFQQKRSGGQAPYIFAMALVFVFLVLAALGAGRSPSGVSVWPRVLSDLVWSQAALAREAGVEAQP